MFYEMMMGVQDSRIYDSLSGPINYIFLEARSMDSSIDRGNTSK
jgi:hypothetical protein